MAIKRKITDEELKELNSQERDDWRPTLIIDELWKQVDEEVDAMIKAKNKARNKRLRLRLIATGVAGVFPPIAFTMLSITNPILFWAWGVSLIIFIVFLSEE